MKRKFSCHRSPGSRAWEDCDVTTVPRGHCGSVCTPLVHGGLLAVMENTVCFGSCSCLAEDIIKGGWLLH